MKTPFVQRSEVQPQSNKKQSGNPCLIVICWLVSLLLWGLIGINSVSIYIYKIIDDKDIQTSIGVSIGLYAYI